MSKDFYNFFDLNDEDDSDLENSFFDLDEVFKEPSKQDHERQLDKIPINILENYLRKKKLHNINKNQNEN